MTMNEHTPDNTSRERDLPETPAELCALETFLDDLGAAERGGAPEALEDRIFIASRAELGAEPVIARIGGAFGARARIAAGFLIVGGVGALVAWLALQPTTPAPVNHDAVALEAAALDEEFEAWLAAASVWDDIDIFSMLDVESDFAWLGDEIAVPWFALEDPLLSEELF